MVRFTREFLGGVLAGLGTGVLIGSYVAAASPAGLGLGVHGLLYLLAGALIPIGGLLARSAQH